MNIIGIKFLLVSDNNQTNLNLITKRVYELYGDYVLKNPFYTPEMPIRCELFDINLNQLLK
jgi:hypothetical protein